MLKGSFQIRPPDSEKNLSGGVKDIMAKIKRKKF